MAVIQPFRGVRFNPDVAGEISGVVSPPYDIISPADRVAYHERSPFNFVRLILGEEFPQDDERENRFTRARAYLDDWLAKGVLKHDESPSIYVYEQEYTKAGRTYVIQGFTLLVRIEEYDKKVVLPHENTLAKPKSGLTKLIRETECNFDSVYGLYPDPEHRLTPALDARLQTPPTAEAFDRDQVRHRLWAVSDKNTIDEISGFLADKQIVIADGHHRYETSMAYRDEMRAADTTANGNKPYDYVLMTIVNVYGKDVTIFPTHRLVGNLPDGAVRDLLPRLEGRFKVESVNSDGIVRGMAERAGKAIGMLTRDGAYLLTLQVDPQPIIGKAKALCELDVSVLHRLILEDGLGIDEEKLKHETNIVYTRDDQEAATKVKDGEFEVAFLLNPVNVEATLEVARAGEKMPQKATYFYPKLISGLVLRQM